jgi:hypothetical protein
VRRKEVSAEKRALLAAVLAIAVIVIWSLFMPTRQEAPTWVGSDRFIKLLRTVQDSSLAAWHWVISLAWYWQLTVLVLSGVGLRFFGISAIGQSGYPRGPYRSEMRYTRSRSQTLPPERPIRSIALSLICLLVCFLVVFNLLRAIAGVVILMQPSAWAWYWQFAAFVFLFITVLVLVAVIVGIWSSNNQKARRVAIILGIFATACFIPCAFLAYRLLQATYQAVTPRIRLGPIGISAAIALAGSLIANGVNKSAYSRSTSHEWRFVKGGRYKDATNLDVWEHLHGPKSWNSRIRRQRVIWVVLATVVAVLMLGIQGTAQEIRVLWVTGGSSLFVGSLVMILFTR